MTSDAAPIRVAVIGAGEACRMLHLPVLARLQGRGALALMTVCDLRTDRAMLARREFGFRETSGDAAAAIARPDIDAVCIFGSAQMHYAYGLHALRSGKHIFVEKPVAPSFEQARLLGEAARTRNLVAVGGHNRRFYKSLDAVRRQAGKAGWDFAEAIFHKPEFGKPVPYGAKSWLTANGIHALDALIFMMGDFPAHVAAAAHDGAYSAILRWKNGAQASFLCNNKAGARHEEYVFHAPGLTCRLDEDGLAIHTSAAISRKAYRMTGDGVEAEHEAFLDAIRSASSPRHAIEAIAPSLFLAERIEEGFIGDLILPDISACVPPRLARTAVLVAGAETLQAALTHLPQDYRIVTPEDVRRSPGTCPDVRAAILGRGAAPLTDDLLNKLPNLGVVGVAGLSLARYRPEPLLQRGVSLVNASAAYAQTVADFAFALAVLGRRRAFASAQGMRRGGWGTDAAPAGFGNLLRRAAAPVRPAVRALGLEPRARSVWKAVLPRSSAPAAAQDLSGARVGLIGWGANAKAFCERLVRAGAHVLVYSEHAAVEEPGLAKPTPLADVLAADIVSLHRGLTPETKHFLGAAELARLRPGTVLINVARGALIEPQALLARLRKGDIFACLDTFAEEPLPRSHPLRFLPNVFLTSHIAGGSPQMHANAAEEVVGKVTAWLNGDKGQAIAARRLRTMS